ncbi:MAG: hypothetical protein ACP5O8_04355, partial [Candidatus Aenigmatarchaeota archaeon]
LKIDKREVEKFSEFTRNKYENIGFYKEDFEKLKTERKIFEFHLNGAKKTFLSREAFYSFMDMLDLTRFYWWAEVKDI